MNSRPTVVNFQFSSQFGYWRIYMDDVGGTTGYLMPNPVPSAGVPPRSNVIAALQEQNIKNDGYVYFRIPNPEV